MLGETTEPAERVRAATRELTVLAVPPRAAVAEVIMAPAVAAARHSSKNRQRTFIARPVADRPATVLLSSNGRPNPLSRREATRRRNNTCDACGSRG